MVDYGAESRVRHELDEINERIELLGCKKLPKIDRYGLQYFSTDTLRQFSLYLEGLFNLTICKNKEAAMKFFAESLTTTETLNNELSRRTLLRLHELYNDNLDQIKA